MKLKDKVVLISGASRGFGLAIAHAFVQQGAHVIICARGAAALTAAQAELQKIAPAGVKVLAHTADMVSPTHVQKLVQLALKEFGHLDIVVANAGIYGPKGAIEEVDWEEWSSAIDINLKGVVLLCREVVPHLKQRQGGKILILSGGGATKPMPYLSAYAASKAAVVRFSETLAEELRAFNIDVNAIAPGALNTRMLDEILEAGPEKVGEAYYQKALQQKETGGSSLEKGAALCAFLASPEANGITGKLISAVWDPWSMLSSYKEELQNSDIYTLRRILPEERGKNWDK